jgi:hypothetical protein
VSDFEERLLAFEARIGSTLKTAESAVAAMRQLRAKAKVGNVAEIEKTLPLVQKRTEEAARAGDELAGAWDFDAAGYLGDGRYLRDLIAAAKELNLELFEKDGRIYCFPLLLRIEPKDAALRIGRKLERRIRPSSLARILADSQKRPQRFTAAQFLELLFKTYRRLVDADWRKRKLGPVVSVAELHETLTLMPGSDYPIEEFARDLLLLDRQPDLRTKSGCRFEFPKSTVSKGGMRRVVAYDEQGGEHLYVGIRFVKEG